MPNFSEGKYLILSTVILLLQRDQVLSIMDVVEILRTLISLPSPYPYEQQIAGWIEEFLVQLKFSVERIPVEDRFNILAKRGSGKALMLFGHLDTVPIQGAEHLNPHDPDQLRQINSIAQNNGWQTDPYTPSIQSDTMYGSGAIDMKAGVAAILAASQQIPESWYETNQLLIVFSVDEEYLDKGMYEILRTEKLKHVQGCICPEIADITEVATTGETPDVGTILFGRRGRIAIEVEFHGKAAHGAMPASGVNAIELAANAIGHIQKSINSGTLALLHHTLLPPSTITTLKISGGTSSLSVPDRCVVEFDRHMVPPETPDQALKDFEACLREILASDQFSVKKSSRPTPFLLPYVISQDTAIARTVVQTLEKLGIPISIKGGNSVADENLLSSLDYELPLRHGVPTVGVGCRGGNYHKENEWVDLRSLQKLSRVILECCKTWNEIND
jgi:acetylornithine deacetylase/succinyl-diaminopimelate desuccinylase-like protein